jgi:hypothetical protein
LLTLEQGKAAGITVTATGERNAWTIFEQIKDPNAPKARAQLASRHGQTND